MGVALVEKLSFDQANIQVESVEDGGQKISLCEVFLSKVMLRTRISGFNQLMKLIKRLNRLKRKLTQGFRY